MKDGVLGRQVADRHEESVRVFQERDQSAEGHGAAQDASASVPDDQTDGDGPDQLHGRGERGVVENGPHVGVPVVAVDGVEFLRLPPLPAEELNHPHAGDRFLESRVDARDPRADRPVAVAQPLAEIE